MVKKPITAYLDEPIVTGFERLGQRKRISATVTALNSLPEDHRRLEAHGRLVDDLISENGSPSTATCATAEAAFDELLAAAG